jgi:hypothetical protein
MTKNIGLFPILSCILRDMTVIRVPLTAIDFEDETFRITEDLDLGRMCPSLEAVGMIHPALLLENPDAATSRIVCGFRRLHGLRRLGVVDADAILLPAEGSSHLGVFLKAIWDNLSHRQLNPLEIARVLFALHYRFGIPPETLIEQFLPILGLPAHRNVLRSYLNLHRVHPELRRLLCAGRLTLATVDRLDPISFEAQATVAAHLSRIQLSASLQREVLDLAEDLAAISKSSIEEVLSQPEIQAITNDGALSPYQKGERLHAALYRRRNPRITQTRERFLSDKAELKLPGHIRLTPDPFFETPRLRVEFDAGSAQAFRQAVESLGRTCQSESLDRLFEVF